ncbi:His Kinase A (phospho-acceptor) domain-containing protein [Anaeromicropila populeti]|uniref:histidine kinase n=2 Tax=Anaeromicropila populeti TaxID=37658 RepID=A0A1I6J932_9FIRM|nr:His Kinase A (phospho-acceptor) domain-containing protein [Anaeromicropila populeti]
MVRNATEGCFQEEEFTESRISKLESDMAEFFKRSSLSSKNLEAEHLNIKSLIADISHQTKTPISNIMLYSELLGEKNLPEDCQELVRQVTKQSEKLDFLIRSLVKTSRLESGIISINISRQNVMTVIQRVVDEIRANAEKKQIAVEFERREALFSQIDARWTEEAIYNIVDNAVKYTPHGGTIRITVSEYEMFVRIDIADNGMGIAEAEQANIFGRFYRSPNASGEEGVGIGLYLARQIVRAEGGYMKVISELGRGATFSVYLRKG